MDTKWPLPMATWISPNRNPSRYWPSPAPSCRGPGPQHHWTCSNPMTEMLPCFTLNSVKALLPPANEVWDKVIFLYLYVILCTGGLPPGGVYWGEVSGFKGRVTPRYYGIQSKSGWYTSYWNAFLFVILFSFFQLPS